VRSHTIGGPLHLRRDRPSIARSVLVPTLYGWPRRLTEAEQCSTTDRIRAEALLGPVGVSTGGSVYSCSPNVYSCSPNNHSAGWCGGVGHDNTPTSAHFVGAFRLPSNSHLLPSSKPALCGCASLATDNRRHARDPTTRHPTDRQPNRRGRTDNQPRGVDLEFRVHTALNCRTAGEPTHRHTRSALNCRAAGGNPRWDNTRPQPIRHPTDRRQPTDRQTTAAAGCAAGGCCSSSSSEFGRCCGGGALDSASTLRTQPRPHNGSGPLFWWCGAEPFAKILCS